MKYFYAALALAAAVILLAGCSVGSGATVDKRLDCQQGAGSKTDGERSQKPREAWISLDNYLGPESVGILMADERGYFDDVGLELMITSGAGPDSPIGYVDSGLVEFGLALQPQVVLSKEEGLKIIAVGALVPRPTDAMIWLEKSKIDGIADLRGKTIAYSGLPAQRDILEIILEDAGLTLKDVELRDLGYALIPALIDGRADAIFGGSGNLEGAALEARGLKPVVTSVGSMGIPAYEEVVVAKPGRIARDPQLIRDFMSAVARGNAAAVEDPEGAADLIEKSAETDPALGQKATEAAVEATLPLLAQGGCMDPDQAGDLVDWMDEEGLVEEELPASELLTNRFVSP